MAMRSRTGPVALGLALLTVAAVAAAQGSVATQPLAEVRDSTDQPVRNGAASQARNGDIYGYQLMTERERSEFRERLRLATTEQERDQIRSEHHAQMQARAAERGVTLAGPRPSGGAGAGAVTGAYGKSAK